MTTQLSEITHSLSIIMNYIHMVLGHFGPWSHRTFKQRPKWAGTEVAAYHQEKKRKLWIVTTVLCPNLTWWKPNTSVTYKGKKITKITEIVTDQ